MQLMRLPNAFTAVADVTAGMVLAHASWSAWPQWCLLAPASFCLYAGGAALNDVCDAQIDRLDRPDRPIPSGQVPRSTAAWLSAGLLVIGLALAAACAPRAGIIAAMLAFSIVLYDLILKETPVAPAVMGGCRALNLGLGMYAIMPPETASVVAPPALMWLYVTSLTVFARKESTGGSATRLAAATIGMLLAIAGIVFVRPFDGGHRAVLYACVLALGGFVARLGLQAARAPSPATTQHSVKRLVLGIVLLDACFAWTALGPTGAVLVTVWLVPATLLSRDIRVT